MGASSSWRCSPSGPADTPYHELGAQRVPRRPARDTSSSARTSSPAAALGYPAARLRSRRRLPPAGARATADGGIYTTAADVGTPCGRALFAGLIVSERRGSRRWCAPASEAPERVEALRPRLLAARVDRRGDRSRACDAGVSFRSVHDPGSALTYTVISNTTDGAWPVVRLLAERLGT